MVASTTMTTHDAIYDVFTVALQAQSAVQPGRIQLHPAGGFQLLQTSAPLSALSAVRKGGLAARRPVYFCPVTRLLGCHRPRRDPAVDCRGWFLVFGRSENGLVHPHLSPSRVVVQVQCNLPKLAPPRVRTCLTSASHFGHLGGSASSSTRSCSRIRSASVALWKRAIVSCRPPGTCARTFMLPMNVRLRPLGRRESCPRQAAAGQRAVGPCSHCG
jgi:hypothetical protein